MYGRKIKGNRLGYIGSLVLATGLILAGGKPALAALTANTGLEQIINKGTLELDIVNPSDASVTAPKVNMDVKTFSFTQQTSDGVLGTTDDRIYVANPDVARNGWTLSIAGAAGAKWQDTVVSANSYTFDGTAATGQLIVNPAAATLAPASPYLGTDISKGTVASFSSSVSSITLLNAAAGSQDIWRGYLTGVGLSQTIPASQPYGTYNINLVMTVVASS